MEDIYFFFYLSYSGLFISFVFFYDLAAYKHADGKKIDGRRVLVDVERARTVKGWLPRRLGISFSSFYYFFFFSDRHVYKIENRR